MKRFLSILSTAILCAGVTCLVIAADHSFPATSGVTGKKTVNITKVNSGKGTSVSFVLTNGSAHPLNGVFYCEHAPATLTVRKGIEIGARGVVFESSTVGAVYPGMVTHTWIVEESGTYGVKNSIAPGKTLEIRYTVTYKGGATAATWEGSCWAGKLGPKTGPTTNAVVGYCDKVIVGSTAIKPAPALARHSSASLLSVWPNPVRGFALFRMDGIADRTASLAVVNAAGQTVRSFVKGANEPAVFWNTCDQQGHAVPSGVYWIRLEAGEKNLTSRVQVIQ